MKRNIPTYEWSEGGLELLANIKGLIEKYGGQSMATHTIILENPDFFRSWVLQSDARIFIRHKTRNLAKSANPLYHWTAKDDLFLIQYKNRYTRWLHEQLPHRTERAIRTRIRFLKKAWMII